MRVLRHVLLLYHYDSTTLFWALYSSQNNICTPDIFSLLMR